MMRLAKRDSSPIFLPGGDTCCLLLHGLAGSPGEMRPLAEWLANCGHTVVSPEWPWSEAGIWQMADTFAGDAVNVVGGTVGDTDGSAIGAARSATVANITSFWTEAVAGEISRLAASGRKLFLIGLSLGGLMVLDQGTNPLVAGIVSIGSPIDSSDTRWKEQAARYIIRNLGPKGEPLALETMGILLDAVARIIDHARDRLARLRCPVLIIHSRTDQVVPPEHAEVLHRLLGSVDRGLLWLQRSPHVSTLGVERARLFQEVSDWLGDKRAN